MIIESVQTRKASVPVGAGDAADREQHERRHAAGDPEGAAPVDVAQKLTLGFRTGGYLVVVVIIVPQTSWTSQDGARRQSRVTEQVVTLPTVFLFSYE